MCELLAVAAREPIAIEPILAWARDLERLGIAGFGWGVAWRSADGVRRYRSERSLGDDAAGRDALGGVTSDRFLVHLRRPSRLSTIELADSQPFLDVEREDGAGTVAFAHNGYLERHDELRPRYASRLRGRADSEVGFELFRERLATGEDARSALAGVHERLGGQANLASLAADGTLLVYAGHDGNRPWRFELAGATVAATPLHSDDDSLFDLVFRDAPARTQLGREAVAIEPAEVGAGAAS